MSMKFIMFINVKMASIVGILTFISMLNTPFKNLKARKAFLFQHFSFYEQLIFHGLVSGYKLFAKVISKQTSRHIVKLVINADYLVVESYMFCNKNHFFL